MVVVRVAFVIDVVAVGVHACMCACLCVLRAHVTGWRERGRRGRSRERERAGGLYQDPQPAVLSYCSRCTAAIRVCAGVGSVGDSTAIGIGASASPPDGKASHNSDADASAGVLTFRRNLPRREQGAASRRHC